MDIFISRGAQDPEVRIRFPAEPDIVWPMLRELDEYCASNDPLRIVGTSALDPNLIQYISCADVEDAADIRKLSELAELVDGMSTEEQRIFAGALDAESVNGLDDVLAIASSLGHYEFIEGVTCDKELGGWLVEPGQRRHPGRGDRLRLGALDPHGQHHTGGRQHSGPMRPSDVKAGAEGVRCGSGGGGAKLFV